jgi:hypothetical protein
MFAFFISLAIGWGSFLFFSMNGGVPRLHLSV